MLRGPLIVSSLHMQRISRFSDPRVVCCHLVEIEHVITPRKITLLKTDVSLEPDSESDGGKNVVISRTSVFRFEEERKLIQNEVNNYGKVALEER